MNAKDFRRGLDKVSPEYFNTSDIWSVFTDGERREVLILSDNLRKNIDNFLGALRSPCCSKWRISSATAGTLSITLTGPELGMEITYSMPIVPRNYISTHLRWEIYGTLRDYPHGMVDRIRLSDAVAVLLGLVNLAPKDTPH